MKAVVLLSGGMDSTTALADCRRRGYQCHALGFDYGQRHRKELDHAETVASYYRVPFKTVDISDVVDLLRGSALTSEEIDVPTGHYTAENMRATVVPNRNAILLAIAYGYAVSIGATEVVAGMHAGDHPIYPDCRPQFVDLFSRTMSVANEGYASPSLRLNTPFLSLTKDQIASLGGKLGVPFELTWSCYRGQALHCGHCGTCVERKEAFELCGLVDPTEYEDTRSSATIAAV